MNSSLPSGQYWVTLTDPDNPHGSPAYEGPDNLAHLRLVNGSYSVTVEDSREVSHPARLHVWGGVSYVYDLPDHMREHAWSTSFAVRVAEILTTLHGFDTKQGESGGVALQVGTLLFTIGEDIGEGGTIAYTQDLTDRDEDADCWRYVEFHKPTDEDLKYRGSWSAYETSRVFTNYVVRSFAKQADKRAAHADHVI